LHLKDRRKEFRDHIWDHSKDPFQLQFDARRNLHPVELSVLQTIVEEVKRNEDDAVLAAFLKKHIIENGPDLTALLLQICGLTRSKIITDLKASSIGGKAPASYARLHLHDTWNLSGPYLAASLRRVFRPLAGIAEEGTLEAINQATYPGYIRQERAKRSGHEAEYRLAVLMQNVGLPFEPIAKLENKPGADISIRGISFDLIVPSAEVPKVVVMSAVHAANIGQYGESKAEDVAKAKAMLDSYDQDARPILLALIDGVGYFSNRAGLDGVLTNADEFCQFSTLWKAVVIAATQMEIHCRLFGPPEYFDPFQAFLNRYPNHSVSNKRPQESIEAGSIHVSLA